MPSLSIFTLLAIFLVVSTSVYAEEKADAAAFAALQMKLLFADQQDEKPKLVETKDIESNEFELCDEQNTEVQSLLAFIPQVDAPQADLSSKGALKGKRLTRAEAKHAVKELVSLSKNTEFDPDCADWQHDIVKRFISIQYKNKAYKQNLYRLLSENKGSEINTLAIELLSYNLLFESLSDAEWGYLTSSFQHTTHQDLKRILDTLSMATASKVQTIEAFEHQINDLLMLAQQGKLGQPLKIKESYVIGLLLAKVQAVLPELFQEMYVEYHNRVEKPVRLEKYVRSYIRSKPTLESYELLSLFLADVSSPDVMLNKRDAKKLLAMLNALKPKASGSEVLDTETSDDTGNVTQADEIVSAWEKILLQHKVIINTIVQSSPAKSEKKQYWLDFYKEKQTKVSQLPM